MKRATFPVPLHEALRDDSWQGNARDLSSMLSVSSFATTLSSSIYGARAADSVHMHNAGAGGIFHAACEAPLEQHDEQVEPNLYSELGAIAIRRCRLCSVTSRAAEMTS